jgi:hypothetical protein
MAMLPVREQEARRTGSAVAAFERAKRILENATNPPRPSIVISPRTAGGSM